MLISHPLALPPRIRPESIVLFGIPVFPTLPSFSLAFTPRLRPIHDLIVDMCTPHDFEVRAISIPPSTLTDVVGGFSLGAPNGAAAAPVAAVCPLISSTSSIL